MNKLRPISPRPAATGRVWPVLVAVAGLWLTGCAQWTYDRTTLGAPLRDAQRNIPEESRLHSDRAVAMLEGGPPGQVDAVVLLLTRDALVCGKLIAAYRPPKALGLGGGSYSLQGELDPRRAGLSDLGPLDALRAIADDLTRVRPEQSAGVAHAWVAAGCVRILQGWPAGASSADEGPAYPRLTDVLELVPAGGESQMTRRDDGVYVISYRVKLTP